MHACHEGHAGIVPRHAMWANYRAMGRTMEDMRTVFRKPWELESTGGHAAGIELVPQRCAQLIRTG